MRIDVLLHSLCLFKTRSQAARACAEERVWLNGHTVRSSRIVHAGDRVRWRDPLGRFEQEVEIIEVPLAQVSRSAARGMYREISRRAVDDPWVA